MAEFSEVVKRKSAMCNYYKDCRECPLGEDNCFFVPNVENVSLPKIEEIIMNWEVPVDWSKVAVDTKVLVRECDGEEWHPKYFAKYKDGKVYVFINGATSWSAKENWITPFAYAKLYKEEE